jgi:Rrf2 family protein
MRINEGVEWGAHCAVVLAMLPDGASLPAARLAEYHGIPAPYLAKSLQALMRAGIVESITGRHGGYRLGRPASEISLLDVFQAVEGDDTFFRCTEIRRQGPARVAVRAYPPVCGIAVAMWRAEAAWRDELSAVTVGDLAVQVMAEAPAAAIVKGSKWLATTLAARNRT